jgi:multidrug efflux pump subunit AcrA (membrane-fusion protein)
MAEIYEYEAQRVHVGQKATMKLAYSDDRTYEGIVTYIYPDLNSMTRTMKARIEFRNSDLSLKPGMYANVELDTGHGSGLVIPSDAVLDSGDRKVVFVQKSQGEFEPREVELGHRHPIQSEHPDAKTVHRCGGRLLSFDRWHHELNEP